MKNFNNTAIKVLNPEHGKEVIKAWQSVGVDTGHWIGKNVNYYYGLFNSGFSAKLSLPDGVRIITIEQLLAEHGEMEETVFNERVMWVGDTLHELKGREYKRVVFAKKNGKYLAWDEVETISECKHITRVITWNHAEPYIEDVPQQPTIEEKAERLLKEYHEAMLNLLKSNQ